MLILIIPWCRRLSRMHDSTNELCVKPRTWLDLIWLRLMHRSWVGLTDTHTYWFIFYILSAMYPTLFISNYIALIFLVRCPLPLWDIPTGPRTHSCFGLYQINRRHLRDEAEDVTDARDVDVTRSRSLTVQRPIGSPNNDWVRHWTTSVLFIVGWCTIYIYIWDFNDVYSF